MLPVCYDFELLRSGMDVVRITILKNVVGCGLSKHHRDDRGSKTTPTDAESGPHFEIWEARFKPERAAWRQSTFGLPSQIIN